MNDIREKIKEICKEKGIKQEVIAEKMGIKQSTLSQKLTRNADIKYGVLLNIADILNVDVIDIIKYPVKYVPEEDNCFKCREKDKTIENLNMLLEEYKKKKGKL